MPPPFPPPKKIVPSTETEFSLPFLVSTCAWLKAALVSLEGPALWSQTGWECYFGELSRGADRESLRR